MRNPRSSPASLGSRGPHPAREVVYEALRRGEDALGVAEVDTSRLLLGGVRDLWLPLTGVANGAVRVRIAPYSASIAPLGPLPPGMTADLLLDDGSPIASLWWGANDAIDVDAIEAAVDAAVPPAFGTPSIVEAKGRTVVKLLGDGSAAYPPLPRARGGGGRSAR